jgi:adenosylhomocysteine nucleosidase
MKRIGIVAALPSELRPLTRHWAHHHHLAHGRIGDIDALAACSGMGEKAVTHACERLLAAGNATTPGNSPIDTLISVGYAGSLSCGLNPPDAVAVREVIDAATGESFPTQNLATQSPNQLKPQRLVTLDHIANPHEKRRLGTTHQATLVDMEAATVARFARAHNLAFLCFKAVTDGQNDELPDFNRFTTPNGRLRIPAFVAWTLWHPRYWRVLGELEKNSRIAAHHLADLVLANFASPSAPTSVN